MHLKIHSSYPVPSGPRVNNDSGHCTPLYITPPHSPAAVTQAQRAWPRMGVNNWHAGGCRRCCICHDASAVVLFICSQESISHAALCHRKTDLRHCLSKLWSIFKDFFPRVTGDLHILISENTSTCKGFFKLLLLNQRSKDVLNYGRFGFALICWDC